MRSLGELQAFDLLILKEDHPGHRVLYVNILGREFVFRSLGKKEYQNILRVIGDEHDLEDMVCQVALIYPDDFDFKDCPLGGLAKTIAPIITELSGYTNLEVLQETYHEYKNQMQHFENRVYAIVKMAFPEFTFEEMEEWTWDQTFKVAVRAEYILNQTHFRDNPLELVERKIPQTSQPGPDRDALEKELIENGVDPMIYFQKELDMKSPYVDFPLIGGAHWQNEDIVNEIRRQMERKR